MNSDGCLGCCSLENLVETTDILTSKTVQKINDTQELVMVNDFARETNETLLKKCLQDRISDIASWRWVLEDLFRRLEDSIGVLKHELKAVNVVVQRLKDEIYENTKSDHCRSGNLCPAADPVEESIQKERNFLREQKRVFEKLLSVVEKQISSLEKTKKRIKNDILNKKETLKLEEGIARLSLEDFGFGRRKKKKSTTLSQWENRCLGLKRDGLKALSKTLTTRQQARGARVHLSIASQALANAVDFVLRKRIHANHSKLLELDWQRQETIRDIESLEAEKASTERSLLANLEQEKLVESRLADRTQRPNGEMTRDEVDRKLKDELGRIRRFVRDLRINLEEINSLQNHLKDQLVKMDCVAEDIIVVLRLDEKRMEVRMGEPCHSNVSSKCSSTSTSSSPGPCHSDTRQRELNPIKEEDEEVMDEEEEQEDEEFDEEEDDYPFSD